MFTPIFTLGMIIFCELQLLTDQRDNVQTIPCPKVCMEVELLTAYNRVTYLMQPWLREPNNTCDELM
jgi:hypothetical protein